MRLADSNGDTAWGCCTEEHLPVLPVRGALVEKTALALAPWVVQGSRAVSVLAEGTD